LGVTAKQAQEFQWNFEGRLSATLEMFLGVLACLVASTPFGISGCNFSKLLKLSNLQPKVRRFRKLPLHPFELRAMQPKAILAVALQHGNRERNPPHFPQPRSISIY